MARFWRNLCFLLGVIFSLGEISAEPLPSLPDHPWFACYAGFERRKCDIAVNNRGDVEIYIKERGARVGVTPKIKIRVYAQEKTGNGDLSTKPIKRLMKKGSMRAFGPPAVEPEVCEFEGTAAAGVVLKVRLVPREQGIEFSGEIVNRGKARGELEVVVEAAVKDFYRLSNGNSRGEWVDQTRGDGMTVTDIRGNVLRVRLTEDPYDRLYPFIARNYLKNMRFESGGLGDSTFSMESLNTEEGKQHLLEVDTLGAKHLTDGFFVRLRAYKTAKCTGFFGIW